MSDWLSMTRRRCLALIVGSVAVSEAWPIPRLSTSGGRSLEAQLGRWRAQLRSPKSAAIVGRAYVDAVSQTDVELIVALGASIGRRDGGVIDLSDAEIGKRLRERIRSDYRDQRTVRLHGWTVSNTEAGLCALYALGETTAQRSNREPLPCEVALVAAAGDPAFAAGGSDLSTRTSTGLRL
jgi:hypothetical protein